MKAIQVLCAVVLAFVAGLSQAAVAVPQDNQAPVADFETFKTMFGRRYSDADEEEYRRRVFEENMEVNRENAAANPYATFGATKFSDLTRAEFEAQYTGGPAYYSSLSQRMLRGTLAELKIQYATGAAHGSPLSERMLRGGRVEVTGKAADAVDWRQRGAVTHVKNQGHCGGCYAFAATANIESQWAIAGNPLTNLSVQMQLSCNTISGGCRGGNEDHVFAWTTDVNKGKVYTEESYPFVSVSGSTPKCNHTGKRVGAEIIGYAFLPGDEEKMAAWMTHNGTICCHVNTDSFQGYTGGVLTNCKGGPTRHAMLIVGFNKTANPPYWILKNSWGRGWGEKGYIRVKFGTNQCSLRNFVLSSFVRPSGLSK